MANTQHPPEVNITVLKTKDLKGKSIRWENIELPIDFLLLTVKECEFLSCLSFLERGFTKSYRQDLGHVYFGDIGEDGETKQKIALMKCNAGSASPGGSTIVAQKAVGALRPKAVISVGYCASVNRGKAKLGDVVVSAKLTTYAPTKHTDDGIEELGHSVPPKRHLADLIKSVDEGWEAPLQNSGELDVKVDRDGVFLSGPEEVKSQERCAQLRKRFPNAVAIEMQGEGLYAAAHSLDIEWIIIKGISEYADGSSTPTDSWRQFASVMAASLTAHMLNDSFVFQTWSHYGGQFPQPQTYGQTITAVPSREPLVPVRNGAKALIRDGTPEQVDLERLSKKLGRSWEAVARRLGLEEEEIDDFDHQHRAYANKAYQMLYEWKKRGGIEKATYEVLYNALTHDLVQRRDLAEMFCLLTVEL